MSSKSWAVNRSVIKKRGVLKGGKKKRERRERRRKNIEPLTRKGKKRL